MKVYLAGGESRHFVHDDLLNGKTEWRPFILESFYHTDANTESLIPHFGEFMLDSGAFTFMENAKIRLNWDEYIDRYADFIVRNNVRKFYELDIDSVVGYDEVKRMRNRLEARTGRQCIPVWHSTRGTDDFIGCSKDYSYIALGGIVGKEWKPSHEKYMPWFIETAHKNGAKIHGLGYTKLQKLSQYHFDSVDSTAWTTGNRFGYLYYFDGKTIKKYERPIWKKLGDLKKVALFNYGEWIKFQKYADINL